MIEKLIQSVHEVHKNTTDQKHSEFNIFSVLQIESEEVRLHSRFLGELLNVSGSHGCKSLFLEQFLKMLNAQDLFPDLNRVTIHIEKYIGVVTPETGGQIDLLLTDDFNNCLIIENKIFAGDQENQLLRYYNFGCQQEKRGGSVKIIYLTLHGNSASDFSIGKLNSHNLYESISYKNNISSWLDECVMMLSENSKLSIILQQYNHLIKKLTGMDRDTEQAKTIQEINKSKENFEAAIKIGDALLIAKCNLLKLGIERVVYELKVIYPKLNFIINEHFGYKYHGLEIHHSEISSNNKPSHVRFSFLADANNCYIEIHPGLKEGIAIEKNQDRRSIYSKVLNPHFPSNVAKILPTEFYWQGEWVIHYFKFNNIFSKVLENDIHLIQQVKSDLQLIIDEFLKVENISK